MELMELDVGITEFRPTKKSNWNIVHEIIESRLIIGIYVYFM